MDFDDVWVEVLTRIPDVSFVFLSVQKLFIAFVHCLHAGSIWLDPLPIIIPVTHFIENCLLILYMFQVGETFVWQILQDSFIIHSHGHVYTLFDPVAMQCYVTSTQALLLML